MTRFRVPHDSNRALKLRTMALLPSVPGLDAVEDPPLAVQGQSPAAGLFSFDKYSSRAWPCSWTPCARPPASPTRSAGSSLVSNAHVLRLRTGAGMVTGVDVAVDGATRTLPVGPRCAVVHPGMPHGMCTTHKDAIDADLFAFLRARSA